MDLSSTFGLQINKAYPFESIDRTQPSTRLVSITTAAHGLTRRGDRARTVHEGDNGIIVTGETVAYYVGDDGQIKTAAMPICESGFEKGKAIKEQLGGKALMMIGAKNLIAGEMTPWKSDGEAGDKKYPGFSFKIGKNAKGVTHVMIFLVNDEYRMQFLAIRGTQAPKVKSEVDGVQATQLRAMIEKHTGLYTSLGTMGKKVEEAAKGKGNPYAFQFKDRSVSPPKTIRWLRYGDDMNDVMAAAKKEALKTYPKASGWLISSGEGIKDSWQTDSKRLAEANANPDDLESILVD